MMNVFLKCCSFQWILFINSNIFIFVAVLKIVILVVFMGYMLVNFFYAAILGASLKAM